jgi:hypothetical protein
MNKAIGAPAMFVLLFWTVGVEMEGVRVLRYFVNFDVLALTFGGVFLLLWSAFPLRDILAALRCGFTEEGPSTGDPEQAARILAYAAECSTGIGVLVAILGLILVLWSADDMVQLPRRAAVCLYSVLLGQLLAKVVFGPAVKRLR